MSSPSVVMAFRESLWTAGYRPVAVKSATKVPFGSAWQERARLTPPEAATAWPEHIAFSTGVLCDGLRVIDVDIDDPTAAYQIQQCAIQLLGRAPIRTRPDSSHFAMFYRTSEDAPKKRTKEGKLGRIEMLTTGSQILVDGIHPGTGKPYEWPNGDLRQWPVQSLTIVTTHALNAFMDAAALIIGSAPKAEPTPQPVAVTPHVATQRELAYAKRALEAEITALRSLGDGSGRNNALNIAAHSIGTMVGAGWMDGKAVAYALLDAATANGYVAKRGELVARKTIESGLAAGVAKPRPPLDDSDSAPAFDPARLTVKGQPIKPQTAPQRARKTVKLIRGADIVEEALTWLWDSMLPSGKLTLLAGAGGTGKSTLAFGLAATVTSAGLWPDGTRCAEPGNVLIWSSEDDPADTIKPRLMAANADESRYGIIAGSVDEQGEIASFDPATDIDYLREAVREFGGGIKLLIIDPIVSAVSGDLNKSNDVRRSLQAIVDFAAEMNCAVIGITHFAKNTEGKSPADRVIGSQAFAAFARMVLVTAKQEDSDSRVLTRAKSNNSIDTGGFRYSIEAVALHRGITATRVLWGEAVEGTSRDILASVENDGSSDDGSKFGLAKAFLISSLADGPVETKHLVENAREMHEISKDTLKRAKAELRIVARKSGIDGPWLWEFPFNPSALTGTQARS